METAGLECKQVAYDTENYDHDHWIEQAPTLCKPGIKAKYVQNNDLQKLLLDTGKKLSLSVQRIETGELEYHWADLTASHLINGTVMA